MKRILIINPFGIGDVLFTMPLVETLRKAFPECYIGFLCNERTVELVRMSGSIDQTFIFNRDRLRKLWKKNPLFFYKKLKALVAMVREARFEVLFDLSLGREYSFFGAWVGIPKRIGLNFKNRGIFLTHKVNILGYENRAVAEFQLDLLSCIGVERPQKTTLPDIRVPAALQTQVEDYLRKNKVLPGERVLAIAPGGGKSWGPNAKYKQWDPESFAQVSNLLNKTHPHKVCLLGDRSEEALLHRVETLLETRSVVLAGEVLSVVSAALQRSWLLLCNDGGMLHLANALGVKTVSIYGPVDEKVYGPYYGDRPHAVLTTRVPCRPCYKQFHFPPCPFDRRCLTELPAALALQAIKEIA